MMKMKSVWTKEVKGTLVKNGNIWNLKTNNGMTKRVPVLTEQQAIDWCLLHWNIEPIK